MKIKVKPEDFIVEEIISLKPSKKGPYTLLKLQKQYWNTLDVINLISRRLKIPKNLFFRAGLKDRYSSSTQYLSFKGEFKEKIVEKNFKLFPVGKIPRPVLPDVLLGNRFSITLRSLEENEIKKINSNYQAIIEYGFPNYFDTQRFGSARHGKGFFAKLIMHQHYNGALKTLLCYPTKEEGKSIKLFKRCCAQHWGDLSPCYNLVPREYKEIVDYLIAHPADYKGAIKKIDREMLNIYLLAYQSFIFNQVLCLVIKDSGTDTFEVPYSFGKFLFYRHLNKKNKEFLENVSIPLINEKVKMGGYIGEKIRYVLSEEGLVLRNFKLSKLRLRGVRFKLFMRPAIVFPGDFKIGKVENDELYRGKWQLTTQFILPPGTYATILIKRLVS